MEAPQSPLMTDFSMQELLPPSPTMTDFGMRELLPPLTPSTDFGAVAPMALPREDSDESEQRVVTVRDQLPHFPRASTDDRCFYAGAPPPIPNDDRLWHAEPTSPPHRTLNDRRRHARVTHPLPAVTTKA
jgi:hypothetical protein